MSHRITSRFLAALRSAFVTPSIRQQEAYGRFAHNLAAACVIAVTSILSTENRYGLPHVAGLLLAGVVCFVVGKLFCRGD